MTDFRNHSECTRKQMRLRHVELHNHLDELIGCFYIETGLLSGNITLLEFMRWSHSMTKKPTCAEKENEMGQRKVD